MNPNQYGDGLSLNISETGNEQNPGLALEVAGAFRLDHKKAKRIMAKIKAEASKWRTLARELKISSACQNKMAEAFRVVN